MMKKIEKNHDFIFPKVKNDGRIVRRKTYGKVLIILRICNKGGTILDFSDCFDYYYCNFGTALCGDVLSEQKRV